MLNTTKINNNDISFSLFTTCPERSRRARPERSRRAHFSKLSFMKRPILLYPLIILHLFLGLGAVYGGVALVLKPDGSLLGMDSGWLAQSPFESYLMPGLVLFIFNGVLPLLTAVGLFFKPQWWLPGVLNLYSGRHWAWAYSLYTGIVIIIWIAVQQLMTEYFWLQPAMTLTGLLIIVFTLIPALMRWFEQFQYSGMNHD